VPIDILYVGCIAPLQRGGSGVLAVELLSGLTGLGHRVRALVPLPPDASTEFQRFVDDHPGIQAIGVPVPVRSSDLLEGSRNPIYRAAEDAGVQAALPALIGDRRPDVILIGRESTVGEIPRLARRHGIPTAALVQGGRALQKVVEGDLDALARRQVDALRQVDLVIPVARHLEGVLASLSLRRVVTIPNPVDLDRFSPGEKPSALLHAHAIDPRHIVVAHVSNLGPPKRPMDVIESAPRVLAANPAVVYLVVGDGSSRAPMEARCRELGIASRLRFVGWIGHDEMPAYMRLSDVVVMSSQHEGLPLVYLEAQASGRLLVASDIPATREAIVDGETGLVYRLGDIEDLAAKTARGAGNAALRLAVGRAARTAVHAHARPVILAAYARCLEDLAAGASASSRRRADPDALASATLDEMLGPDLRNLVEAQEGRLVTATSIGTLPSRLLERAAFRLVFDDGRILKGRKLADESSATRVERLSSRLDARYFPRIVGRRGAALLSEWAEGVPGVAAEDSLALCRQAGALQGALHRTPVLAEDRHRAREHWTQWPSRLQRVLRELVARAALDSVTAARAMAAAASSAPADVEVGLVHGDLCLENVVLDGGDIRVVDTEDLRIYACDHDLARTWYRWPMASRERQAYWDGYRLHRSPREFLEHLIHWAAVVLVESAWFRVRTGAGDAGQPLAQLRAFLASEDTEATAWSTHLPAARP
jgi:glycosyltransferase involved in cell wall biosynthesis